MMRQRFKNTGRVIPPQLCEPSTSWDHIMDAVTPRDWQWLWTEGVANGLFRYGNVITGAIEGVQELNELGDVVSITSRPKAAVHDTLVWLSTMFDKAPLSGLVIQTNKEQRKSDVIPEPDVYIDDALHNAKDVLDNTDSKIILFDQPWNQGGPPDNSRLIRVSGWTAVIQAVKEIKNGN
jgi:5'(3')-deoxyribonucleotidase